MAWMGYQLCTYFFKVASPNFRVRCYSLLVVFLSFYSFLSHCSFTWFSIYILMILIYNLIWYTYFIDGTQYLKIAQNFWFQFSRNFCKYLNWNIFALASLATQCCKQDFFQWFFKHFDGRLRWCPKAKGCLCCCIISEKRLIAVIFRRRHRRRHSTRCYWNLWVIVSHINLLQTDNSRS